MKMEDYAFVRVFGDNHLIIGLESKRNNEGVADEAGYCVAILGQANKRIRWMPWQLEAMKDVGACERLRGVGNQTLIRRCPNGETHWCKPVSLD